MARPLSRDPERILIVRPSALGDVCRTVPVLVSLRRRFPDAQIDWLVQDAFAPAIAGHPDLSRVIRFPRSKLKRANLTKWAWWSTLNGLIRELRGPRYQLVIDCQGLLRSGLCTWVTRAKHRVGYANAAEHAWIGYSDRIDVDRKMHAVDRMLALVESLGIEPIRDLRLHTLPGDRMGIDPRLLKTPYAVMAPTSRWSGKRWPIDRFVTLAQSLLDDGRLGALAIVASANERSQCGPLLDLARGDPRVIDLVGHTDVGRLMAVIERSSLVIANDSAALHMAVGFNRPMIGLYGPTRTELVGPYRRDSDVIHGAPGARDLSHKDEAGGAAAMASISVETVIAAAMSRLDSHPPVVPPPPVSPAPRVVVNHGEIKTPRRKRASESTQEGTPRRTVARRTPRRPSGS